MSILDRQARLRVLGNLRMGTKGTTSEGKEYPKQLDTWRITSADQDILNLVAQTYGGEVKPWDQQYEVITTRRALPVEVPPQEFDQWYKLFSGAGILRKCDGINAVLYDKDGMTETECVCDPTERECKVVTNVLFFLPEIPGLGAWKLSTTSSQAGDELRAIVPMVAGSNRVVNLRIDKREIRRPGQQPHRFPVAVLDAPISLSELRGSAGNERLDRAPSLEPNALAAPPHTVEEPEGPVHASEPALAEVGEEPPLEADLVDDPGPPVPHGPAFFEEKQRQIDALVDQMHVDLEVLLDNPPTPKERVDEIRSSIRELFRLMESSGYWSEGSLAAVLRDRGQDHLSDMGKDLVLKLAGDAWAAAKGQIGET